jgi:hypothetical protein
MVQPQRRTTEKGKWMDQELHAAIRVIKERRGVKGMAQQFSFARTTPDTTERMK